MDPDRWEDYSERVIRSLEGDGPLWFTGLVMLLAVVVFGGAVLAALAR